MLRSSPWTFLYLVLFVPLLSFAQQVDPDLADDAEAKADIQPIIRKQLEAARVPETKSSSVGPTKETVLAPSSNMQGPIVLDEEDLYQRLESQWILMRRDIRDFRSTNRPLCEQNTDLKQNEWHFLRRISDYITFQTERLRDTHEASEGIEKFAMTRLQSMLAEKGKVSLLKESPTQSRDRLTNDLSLAAVNLLLADMVLTSHIDELRSGGVWKVAGVPVPRRLFVSFVQDQVVIFAWYKWAKLAKQLPGLKRLANANVIVKLSPQRLPPICRSPKSIQACLNLLNKTQRVALRMGQGIVFSGGGLAATAALWSDVWSKAIDVGVWFYLRRPRWKEHFADAVANYESEIRDLCFYRQCYETRMQRRVSEKRELGTAIGVFEDPLHPHFQLKQYCSNFSVKRGAL
ncbi:MAG: hypothetical protein K2X47_04525 [Bdellovibrionales bacterium]|nr:hypothetical protein [Bdellovibrionales bacterium]